MKNIITSFCFLIFFTFTIAITAQSQMQSGSFFFDKNTPSFTLDKNSGKRYMEKEVYFNKPFETKPNVIVTVTVMDAESGTQIRHSAEARAVSRDGFMAKITVWGDTRINGLGGFWFAESQKLELEKEEIEVGKTIVLNNIYFEFNKATLLPDSYQELNQVTEFLNQPDHKSIEIELAGHTDNIGSDEYNNKLSQQRAEAVKSYLVAQGVAENRMQAKGYGESRPIATNETEWGREQNRRVEFTILKK